MNFGDRVRELRLQQKFSQSELSEKSGLTLRTIQRIEKNEVKPSLHSMRVLGEALKSDLSVFEEEHKEKPYEINFSIKINDMNQLISDFKTLLKNNWKILLIILLIVLFVSNYTAIKSGIVDGWNSK